MNGNAERISDTEAEVMKVVWHKNEPITYSEIRTALSEQYDWGGQVINTMLKRLVKKEVLHQEKNDVYYYSALVSEADYKKVKTMTLLKKLYAGNAKGLISALIHYDEVSQADLDDLRGFWDKEKTDDE